jgi:hypothetical protein
MKKMFSLLLILVSSVAYADQLCGLLQSQAVAPVCDPGQICPAHMTMVYTITPANGTAVTIGIPDLATLQNVASLDGTNVCVDGAMGPNNAFVISDVNPQSEN